MSKAIFLGESIYPRLGMREILRGSSLYIDIAYYSSQTLSAVNIIPYEMDCIIINPDNSDFLKYARLSATWLYALPQKLLFWQMKLLFLFFKPFAGGTCSSSIKTPA